MPAGKLTALGVTRLRRPGKYYDRFCGLFIQVYPSGAKCWQQRVQIYDHRRTLGVGGFPTVSLAEARKTAMDRWVVARRGGDPRVPKRRCPTFAEAADAVFKRDAPTWKDPAYPKAWMRSLNQFVLPSLGSRPVSQITKADVLDILEPIWNERLKLARLLRQRIRTIMAWAVARDYCTDNPAGPAIDQALPRTAPAEDRHYDAVPYQQVAAVLAAVRSSRARPMRRLVFEFIVLTAVRSGEARGALWPEIDFDKSLWTIPASRMKANRVHKVPLSDRAVEILHQAQALGNGTELVFPGAHGGGPYCSDALASLLRSFKTPGTVHGFRSSFRDWVAECVPNSRESAEAALAHVVKDRTEGAYFRTPLVTPRRELMQLWADYVTSTE